MSCCHFFFNLFKQRGLENESKVEQLDHVIDVIPVCSSPAVTTTPKYPPLTTLNKRKSRNNSSSTENSVRTSKTNQNKVVPIIVVPPGADVAAAGTVFAEKDKWKILVTDDSAVCRKTMARILKMEGHYVDEADDGIECIFMVQLAADYNNEPYDCITLDDDMPHMKGHEAVKLLRSKGFNNLLVIGVTGNLNDDHLQTFRDNGADIVIRKPLTEERWKNIYNTIKKNEDFTNIGV